MLGVCADDHTKQRASAALEHQCTRLWLFLPLFRSVNQSEATVHECVFVEAVWHEALNNAPSDLSVGGNVSLLSIIAVGSQC